MVRTKASAIPVLCGLSIGVVLGSGCQLALRYQTTPREQLVRSDPMPAAGHQADS